ncbi:MAG: tRNA (N6-isopentenyl adenosine(37)-C2)-methylthiotransferase MiaB [Candidatus Eisenbacteria bacterium]|nr:tRNA (N6-isopentenyl adenosine(37)-C2)-methylthiotransferase MiaB [Candidatus Eisenbacteria bacterium]
MGRRVYIETYGCQMNVADSELMGGILEKAGFVCEADPSSADVILVNTCAIRESPEDRVVQRLAQLARRKELRPDLVLGITGCVPKHVGPELQARLPGVDLIIGPDSYRRLPELIDGAAQSPRIDLRMDPVETYDGALPRRTSGINAWVTVMRGCDRFCRFCVVPYVRGREKCVPMERILAEVRGAAAEECRSITLLGQTVNTYRDEDRDFGDLLRAVARVPGVRRVRFTSPHPSDFHSGMFAVMRSEPGVCPHIHLPVQSGSDSVLRAMRRGYTRREFLKLVREIRDTVPGMALTTDIIVGFPGETQADYEATLSLMEEVRFDSAFMFKYSPRTRTYAWKHQPDGVPEEVKGGRLRRVIDLQEKHSRQIYAGRVGRVEEVLVEGPARKDPSRLQGKTPDFKTVVFDRGEDPPRAGELVAVAVTAATSHTLTGHRVVPAERTPAGGQ